MLLTPWKMREILPLRELPVPVSGLRSSYSSYQTGNSPKQKVHAALLDSEFLHSLNWNKPLREFNSNDSRRLLAHVESSMDPIYGTQEDSHPLMLAARMNDEDTPTFEQATNGPHREKLWEAMETEIATLRKMNVWDEVDRQPWMNVLPGVCAFKLQRLPSGEVKKHKGSFCCGGHRQIFEKDYFDVWAPLVNWTTVRLLLVLSVILNLAT